MQYWYMNDVFKLMTNYAFMKDFSERFSMAKSVGLRKIPPSLCLCMKTDEYTDPIQQTLAHGARTQAFVFPIKWIKTCYVPY